MGSRSVACLALAALGSGVWLANNPLRAQRGTTPGTTPTGLIAGRVVDAASGQPLAGAAVTLSGGPRLPPRGNAIDGPVAVLPPPSLLTGTDGQFAFRGLGRGAYTAVATRSGYLRGGFGMLRPEGSAQAIPLDDGGQRTDIVIRLFRYASISGTVFDDTGEPLVGARVVASRLVLASGRRTPSPMISVMSTDDRGRYRFGTVTPGEYIVGVPVGQTTTPTDLRGTPVIGTFVSADRRFVTQSNSPLSALPDATGQLRAYATTYFPAARSAADATPIEVRSGDDRQGVDIVLSLGPTASISGHLVGPPPQSGPIRLRLVASGTVDAETFPLLDAPTATVNADGAFGFFGVPAGRYVVQTTYQMQAPPPAAGTMTPAAAPGPQARPMAWAETPVVVATDDINGLVVTAQPGLVLEGRIEVEGGLPAEGLRLSGVVSPLTAARGGSSFTIPIRPGQVSSFSTAPLQPGRYAIAWAVTWSMSPGTWALKSMNVGGLDVSDSFELVDRDLTGAVATFTDRPSTIGGTVRVPTGSPDAAVVLAFPSDSRYWQDYGQSPRRLISARVTPKGTFGPVPLPPGDYCVVAIEEAASADWQDPRTLESLSRQATRVSLTEGQTLTVDLTRTSGAAARVSSGMARQVFEAPEALPGGPLLAFVARQVRDVKAPAPAGTGSVSGAVLAADGSNRPIPGARVSLRPVEGLQDYATRSDGTGRFGFPSVPPGRYTLTVTKPAYLTAHYGTGQGVLPPGLPIAVADGQRVSDLTLRLTRGGVISGVVTDGFGLPASGVAIQVLQPIGTGDEQRLGRVVIQGGAFTDDRGVFRIFGLQPDRYIVGVEGLRTGQTGAALRLASDPDRSVTYAPVYYPGTPRAADAAFVTVAAGEETTGIDIPMRLVPTARVEGTVTRADGQPMGYVQVQLIPRLPQAATTQIASGHTPEDRRSMSFVTNAVPPGEYTLIARVADTGPTAPRPSPTTNPLLWAQQDLDIDSHDISGVHLVLRPAMVLTGRVVFEGTTRDAIYDAKDLQVLLSGVGAAGVVSAQPPADVDAEGRFAFLNIVPGLYRVTASALSLPGSAPVGIWSLVSAKAGDRDLLDYPLEVRPGQPPPEIVLTYTNRTSELSGRVLDGSGKPILGLSILLFTTDRALWAPGSRRVRAPARPADDGTFRFFNVPPGEYFLGVATDVDPAAAGDPSFLERVAPAAIRVAIAPGEQKVQDLRIAGRPLAAALAGRPATPSRRAR